MGTANFHNKNASNIFALKENDWDFKNNLLYHLKKLDYCVIDNHDPNELRSFPSRILADKAKNKLYGDAEIIVSIKSIIRSGYYSGINLDWESEIYINNYELNNNLTWDIQDLFSDFMNKGLAKIHAPNATAWIENTKDSLIEELESVYKEYSTPLYVVARASNGETMYREAK